MKTIMHRDMTVIASSMCALERVADTVIEDTKQNSAARETIGDIIGYARRRFAQMERAYFAQIGD